MIYSYDKFLFKLLGSFTRKEETGSNVVDFGEVFEKILLREYANRTCLTKADRYYLLAAHFFL